MKIRSGAKPSKTNTSRWASPMMLFGAVLWFWQVPASVARSGLAEGDFKGQPDELAKLSDPRPVTISIFDLNGRPVRQIKMQQKSGTQVVAWDGRDNDGDLVPPGLFLFQINVATGDGVQLNGAVAVAY